MRLPHATVRVASSPSTAPTASASACPTNAPTRRRAWPPSEPPAAIATLLGELSVPRDRELLRRFYLLEHDRDQVCAALGIDPGHFHRVIHRARQRFGEILARHGLGTGPG